MAFNFDEANPGDTGSIPAFPANERAFRTATKGAINVEHDPAEGRHKFAYGDATARNAISTWVNGSLYLLEEDIYYRPQIRVGGVFLDVVPPSRYANRDGFGQWSAQQYASVTTITPGGGSPNTIALPVNAAPHRRVTLTANSILSNPTGFPGSISATITLEVLQDGTGNRTLTYDTIFRSQGGITPSIALTANAVSLLILTRLYNGDWVVNSLPDIKDIP